MTKSISIKPPREANIELLRIVLMMMIIFHHLIVHARNLKLLGEKDFILTSHTLTDGFIDSFLIMGVNCFVFISGYYGFKFRIKTVLGLFLQAFLYSLIINVIYDYFFTSLNFSTFSSSFFPVFKGYWWFITTYICLYMLSPLLNIAREQLNKFQFLYVTGILTAVNYFISYKWDIPNLGVNNGYSLIGFITIYFYGHVFKEYITLKRNKYFYLIIYVLASLCIFGMFFLVLKFSNSVNAYKAFAYNNPFVVIAAISFFFVFKEMQVKSAIILKVSPLVLGVYLIHDHKKMRILLEDICNRVEASNINIYLSLLLITLFIFIGACFIEWGRSRISSPFVDFLIRRFKLDAVDGKINNSNSHIIKP